MSFTIKPLFGVVVAATLVASCSSGSGSPKAADAVTIALATDPGDLDPHTATQTSALAVADLTYETLLRRGDSGKLLPGLATDWKVTTTSVDLTIRKDVTCSDGSALTADTVADNLRRLASPDLETPYTESYLGGQDFTVEADAAAGTVAIKLKRPFGDLIANLSSYPHIVCDKGLANEAQLKRGAQEGFGSGPYVLKSSTPGSSYVLERRTDTDSTADAETKVAMLPKTAEFTVVESGTTRANLLLTGDLDIAQVSGNEEKRLTSKSELTKQDVVAEVDLLYFNHGDGRPTSDPAVRSAVSTALDRAAYTKLVGGGTQDPADSMLRPGTFCYAPLEKNQMTTFDAEAAKAQLRSAGWEGESGTRKKNGKDLVLTFVTSDTPAGGEKEYFLEALKEIGVDVQFDRRTGDARLEPLFEAGDWDVAQLTAGFALPSGHAGFLSGPFAPKGSNFSLMANDEYDDLVKSARASVGADSCTTWRAAEEVLLEGSHIAPLRFDSVAYFGRAGVAFKAFDEARIDPLSLRVSSSGSE